MIMRKLSCTVTLFLWILALCVVEFAAGDSISVLNSRSSESEQQQQQQKEHEAAALQGQPQSRSLAKTSIYTMYNLPPFSIEFRIPSPFLLNYDNHGDNKEPSSSLTSPLKLITSEFLMESFRMFIYQSSVAVPKVDIPEVVWSFQTIDMQVIVRDEQRLHAKKKKDRDSLSTLNVDFYIIASFLNPPQNGTDDVETAEATNLEIYEMFGKWIEQAFNRDQQVYLQYLRASEQETLQQIQGISEFQIDAFSNEEDTSTIAVGVSGTVPAALYHNKNAATTKKFGFSSPFDWTAFEKIAIFILIAMFILSFIILFFVKRRINGIRVGIDEKHSNNAKSLDDNDCYGDNDPLQPPSAVVVGKPYYENKFQSSYSDDEMLSDTSGSLDSRHEFV